MPKYDAEAVVQRAVEEEARLLKAISEMSRRPEPPREELKRMGHEYDVVFRILNGHEPVDGDWY